MWLDRNELVSLDLKLTSDYGDIIPKIQIGYDLFMMSIKKVAIKRSYS